MTQSCSAKSKGIHIMARSCVLAWYLLLSTTALATAQEPFAFHAGGPYREQVPQPEALLGYGPGARHTQYTSQQAVLDAMATAAPDRVRIEEIGVTEEGRVMRVFIVSAPENIARLDDIRADLARLADPRTLPDDQRDAVIARTPAAVMLSYSIHGNEPAGFESVMWVAYELLASDDPATVEVLRNTVVILNPSANPDGHERFAVWSNSVAVGTDEPYTLEWDEPWSIWGRYGHYRFDMNRDFMALSQAPTRAMVGAIVRWHPQVFVDLHSTTEQYFFPPVADPVNANLPPATVKWFSIFGRGNAETFDRYGWQYFTRDIFDLFYTGYFDAGPSLHGAIGMTYESDGGKALKRRRDDGTVITFEEGIAHHYAASLATVRTAAQHREALLSDYHQFRQSAMDDASRNGLRRVLITSEANPTHAARLATLLLQQEIEVARLTEPYTARASSYIEGPHAPATTRTFPVGTYVVDLEQPQGRLARALLERHAEFDSAFVRRQIAKFERNRRRAPGASSDRYEFYDITAWSLPLTLGLETFGTVDGGAITTSAVRMPDEGDGVRAIAPPGGVDGRARSAYLFANDRQAATELALALLAKGFALNVSGVPVSADGLTFPRGTFVIRTSRNPETIHDQIAALARTIGVPVKAVQSAFPDSGQIGIGANAVDPVFQPKILVAAGDAISVTSYGALWHYLDQELRYPFVPVPLDAVGRMHTMVDYNVFIVPSGSASGIRRALGEDGVQRLKQWVRDGGVLIAYDGAALFPGHDDVGLGSVKAFEPAEDEAKDANDSLPSAPDLSPPLASPAADPNRPAWVPGSIFRATLDMTHWLTMGYRQKELPVMVRGSRRLAPSERGDNPVVFVGDSLHLAGFTWPANTEKALQKTIWAGSDRVGRGHVVVFADDPLYRAFWRGPARLLTNAILFGSGR
jgi:hypothetical protein